MFSRKEKGSDRERREFLKKASLGILAVATVVGAAGIARQVLAGEINKGTVAFDYVPSKLGIDYRKLAPSPLAEILSQGEPEWMKNAKVNYEEDTVEVWKEDLAPEIATGAISMITIENLREFTPKMLTKFTALNPQDPKYGGLWSVGNLFIAEKIGGKV